MSRKTKSPAVKPLNEHEDRVQHIRMTALTDWRRAQTMAEEYAAELARKEVPVRVRQVKGVIQRFAPQIQAMGVDPDKYLADQDTSLMRADAWTTPTFRRTVS